MAILRTQTASFDPTLIFGNSFFFHSKWKLSMFITLSRFAKNLRKKLLILECFRFVFFFFSSVERMLHDFTGRLNDKS